MTTYFNENGKLEDFAEETRIVVCKICGKRYRQSVEEQVPGFRDRSEDICPYCNKSNGSSMSEEYTNSKLSDES